MNLIMPKLNQVRFPARSREVVSPYLSPGMPRDRSLHRDSLFGKVYQEPGKGTWSASLNNPVQGGTILLKSWSSSVGISIDWRTRSHRKTHGHSRSLDWWKKRGRYIPCPFSSIFMNSEEIGIVYPQGPWEHLDRWFFHIHEVVGECATWDRYKPLDLS